MEMKNDAKTRVKTYLNSDRYILVSKSLSKEIGIEAAGLVSVLVGWQTYLEDDLKAIKDGEPFYLTQSHIENICGISRKGQATILNKLKELGILDWERKGVPAKSYYTINMEVVESLILKNNPYLGDDTSSSAPVVPKRTTSCPKTHNYINELENSMLTTSSIEEVVNIHGDGKPSKCVMDNLVGCPNEVMKIIRYWNSSPGLPKLRIPPSIQKATKRFTITVDIIKNVLNGNFFTTVGLTKYSRPYDSGEIISVIDRYKLAATHRGFFPTDKEVFKNVSLNDFFYSPYSSVASQFVKYLTEEPIPVTNSVAEKEQKNPQLTEWLMNSYVEKILLGNNKEFSQLEKNKFIDGANKLFDTMRSLNKRLNMMTRPQEWCDIVIDSLVDKWGIDKVVPGHVASTFTYTEVLIRFLAKKGRIG